MSGPEIVPFLQTVRVCTAAVPSLAAPILFLSPLWATRLLPRGACLPQVRDLDVALSEAQRAECAAFSALLLQALDAARFLRFADEAFFAERVRPIARGALPSPLGIVLPRMWRGRMLTQFHAKGLHALPQARPCRPPRAR